MELRQLEYFLACCEQGTFTAAARSLHVVQSAVSSSIAKLEREIGATVFDRTPTTLMLTEAGRAIVEPARTAVRARADVFDAARALRGDIRGEVALGAMVNLLTIDLAETITHVHRAHPGITIAMRQDPQGTAGNVRGLLAGTLDLALLGGLDDDPPGLVTRWLAAEPLMLVCHPDHRLARAGEFRIRDLDGERTIDYPPGWGTRAVTDRFVPNRHSVIEVADQNFGAQLAHEGFGVSLIPATVARDQPEAVAVPCVDADLLWHVGIAYSAARTPSSAARVLLDAVIDS